MVDVQMDVAEFREASGRRHDTSSQIYRFDNKRPHLSCRKDLVSTTGISNLDVEKNFGQAVSARNPHCFRVMSFCIPGLPRVMPHERWRTY